MATLLFFTCLLPTEAQEKEWDRTLGGSQRETLREIYQTDDGGYIIVGFSESGPTGDKTDEDVGVWVVKLGKEGNKEWDKAFAYFGVSVQLSRDGGYIVAGTRNAYPNEDYWIGKLDANGNLLWERTFGSNGSDLLSVLVQTDDGGYVLGGTSDSVGGGDKSEPSRGWSDYWIVKLDASGMKEWDKTLGSEGQDVLTAIAQTEGGGFIVGGYSWSDPSGDRTGPHRGEYDYWVVKLDSKGGIEWDNAFGGGMVDILVSLQQTSDGGYILGGYSQSNISGDKSEPNWDQCPSQPYGCSHDYWVIKLDSDGHKEWDRTLGGSSSDVLSHVRQTPDGGYILGGYSLSGISGNKSEPSRGGSDYWVVKLDAFGNKQWDRTYGGSESDNLISILLTSDGGYLLGGTSSSGISGDKSEPSRGQTDYWVVKLSGEEPCTLPTPSITIIPTSDIYTGGDPATIYLGYGPQSVQLIASGAKRYEWSPATGLSSNTIENPVFTPSAPGSYTFTVTAYNGACSATATVTITVVDVRCGNGKVRLCHKGQALCIAPAAVASHLRNHPGDRLGSCGDETAAGNVVTVTLPLRVFPNPFRDWAKIAFSLPLEGRFRLELYNASGRMIGVVAEGQGQGGEQVHLELRGEQLREGVYYLKLITADQLQTVRLVLKK